MIISVFFMVRFPPFIVSVLLVKYPFDKAADRNRDGQVEQDPSEDDDCGEGKYKDRCQEQDRGNADSG